MSDKIPHMTDCFKANEIDRMVRQLDDIHKVIYRGNGVPPMTVRIDRLEGEQRRRNRLAWIAISAGITAVVGLLLEFVARHLR